MKWVVRLVMIVAVGALALSFWQNRAPLTQDVVALRTDQLMSFGAVDFVHGGYDGPERELFDCVADGRALSAEHSRRYRTAYQGYLLEKQALFRRLDSDIRLRDNAGEGQPNNVGGQGIAGRHDHHDASAHANLLDIHTSLQALAESGPLRRAWLANDIYKDLTDLMVHMAPAVQSVGLIQPEGLANVGVPPDLLGAYLGFYSAMKDAQAADINSQPYWAALEQAQGAYRSLILAVQSRIRAENGALLHMLSGNWLALQTVAPRLSDSSPRMVMRRAGGVCG